MALRVSKADIALILLTVIASLSMMLCMTKFLYSGTATGVEVEYNGSLYKAYRFSELPSEKTLEIKTDIGYNIINITHNTVVVTESSCNDRLCVGKTLIKPNSTVICLPNRLVVRLVGEKEVDSVSY